MRTIATVLIGLLTSTAPGLVTAETYSPDLFSGLSYRMIGPSRGGRVTAVAGHKDQPSTFYLGAAGGSVFKSIDYGDNWFPVSDGYFATGSIGAIRVADSDPNIVYVATGSDGLRSNVIIGKGVYKSSDAGETWEHVGLEETGNAGAILIHPENSDLVYVAAIGNPFASNPERGVYRTKDGGDDLGEGALRIGEDGSRRSGARAGQPRGDLRQLSGVRSGSRGRSSVVAKRAVSTSPRMVAILGPSLRTVCRRVSAVRLTSPCPPATLIACTYSSRPPAKKAGFTGRTTGARRGNK